MQSVRRLLSFYRHCQIRYLSQNIFDIHPQIQSALHEQRPIVACETAILTHGLPTPLNIETCLHIEKIIYEHGSIPATIGILNGRIKIGLTQTEIEQLGTLKNIEKASRRDLPYLISRRASAGTTVAATMLIAHRCGIPLFATGGIGGVHRDSITTGDISSDLDELGRTPVCVVSSGVKSILDIPKTLEYLETKGVGVYTFGENNEFPNFFTRSNEFGSRSCAAIKSIDEAAQLVQSMIDLKLDSGLLLAVPIDKQDELETDDGIKIETIIHQSLEQATQKGITGNKITPFVLGEIRRQTNNRSIKTNQNLIYKNARIASQIAVALSSIKKNSSSLIIIGARNLDLHIQLNADFIPNKGSTIPCRLRQNFGGVAYNITHALHLLKTKSIRLLTVSGRSNSLIRIDSTPVDIHEIEGESIPSYISLLDSKTNELICGFGDMEIYEKQITPKFLEKNLSILINHQWIMFDANLSQLAMKYLIDIGIKYQKNLVFISAGGPIKAQRIRSYLKDIHVIFCNRLEFEAITNSSSSLEMNLKIFLKENSNIKLICITMGVDGVLIGINGKLKKYQVLPFDNEREHIQNVTGAGDSFAAGVMSQLLKLNFNNIDRSIACGLLAAKLTLTSPNTISEQLKIIDDNLLDEICSKQLRYKNIDL